MSAGQGAPRTRIRGAEIDGLSVDVLLESGRIAAIDPTDAAGPDRGGDADLVIEAAGGALLPGLHDHHVHLLAMAARRRGVDLDRIDTQEAFEAEIIETCVGPDWVRAAGYDEHRHGPLDRHRLDALAGPVPLRVQHRSGLSWVLSSAALERIGIDADAPVERDADGVPTGWVHRADGWLAARIGVQAPALAPVGHELAAFGITGVTDATVGLDPGRLGLLLAARAEGAIPQQLLLLGVDDEAELGRRAQRGPAKLLADEFGGLDPDALTDAIRAHHDRGRAVAIHAVTRAENIAAVAALRAAGVRPGDRIEHGSVLPTDLDAHLAAGGITVIIQPALVAERGDHHLRAVDPEDLPLLHRQASLLAAGVAVAAGSDAPVTSADPWRAIAAATDRRTRSGAVLGPAERVSARTALDWFLTPLDDPAGSPRRVEVGATADLCLLDVPLATMLAAPDASHVRATWIDGVRIDGVPGSMV